MSNVKWNPVFNLAVSPVYVFDFTNDTGASQIVLATAWPGSDGSVLTQDDADNAASTVRSILHFGLTGVTSHPPTTLGITSLGESTFTSLATMEFDSAAWECFLFKISIPTAEDADAYTSAILLTASPADGVLSTEDIGIITADMVAWFETMNEAVTTCTVAWQVVTPTTV